MKKLTFLLALLMLSCSSCSGLAVDSEPVSTDYYDENGNFVYESDDRRSVHVSEIPASIPYNGKSITLTDVSFYQNCVDYSYTLFIVSTLDISELDDSELHWLRESDISVDSYITCEANKYDFESTAALGSVLFEDDAKLVFVETSSFFDENRHGFENSEVSACVSVTQEETYEYKRTDGTTSELNKTEEISYKTTTGDSITDAEQIEEPVYGYIAKWLNSKASFFS